MYKALLYVNQLGIQFITQSYNITFHDVYMILANNLLTDECRLVWDQPRIHVEEINQADDSHPELQYSRDPS